MLIGEYYSANRRKRSDEARVYSNMVGDERQDIVPPTERRSQGDRATATETTLQLFLGCWRRVIQEWSAQRGRI